MFIDLLFIICGISDFMYVCIMYVVCRMMHLYSRVYIWIYICIMIIYLTVNNEQNTKIGWCIIMHNENRMPFKTFILTFGKNASLTN